MKIVQIDKSNKVGLLSIMSKTKSMTIARKARRSRSRGPSTEYVFRDGVLYSSMRIAVAGLGIVRAEKPHEQILPEIARIKLYNFVMTGKSSRNAPPGYYASSYPMDAETQELERVAGLINQFEG
jgi:hypothetical protein